MTMSVVFFHLNDGCYRFDLQNLKGGMTLFGLFLCLIALDHPVIRSNQELGIAFAPLQYPSSPWNLVSQCSVWAIWLCSGKLRLQGRRTFKAWESVSSLAGF